MDVLVFKMPPPPTPSDNLGIISLILIRSYSDNVSVALLL